MYIAGRDTWRITIDEPTVLRLALYVREVERLRVSTDPPIPPLDPGPRTWPVWSHRPRSPAPPMEAGAVDRAAAGQQWALWWNHLLPQGDSALVELRGPAFHALSGLPALQTVVRHHFDTALAWAEAIGDDPRIKRDHLAAGTRLTALVDELERARNGPVRPFELMLTVLGVRTKHAWVLSEHQLLLTHHLIADDENAIDWLRRRLGALA
jgi:hypothetical protein